MCWIPCKKWKRVKEGFLEECVRYIPFKHAQLASNTVVLEKVVCKVPCKK